MTKPSKPEAIEWFHLALLQVMPLHIPQANYAVKGGANLRLFLGSERRSEDIDFNFVGHTTWSLQTRMDAVLRSPALTALLAANGLKIVSINPSKTTNTTGRWKFEMTGPSITFNSKIEFSMRREDRPLFRLDPVAAGLAAAASIRRSSANHYTATGAVEQKIAALAYRSAAQARDIFDLDFLFTRYPRETEAAQPAPEELELASTHIFETTYAEYRELVVTYLDPAFAAMYEGENEWNRMALEVSDRLDAMLERPK
jgi:hypothetical protein